ncbi:MAG TPA: hypothetical protein VL985_14790 [Stellaceae bacterium]|nr:hypothetical protein [Stellaceae bacterium]
MLGDVTAPEQRRAAACFRFDEWPVLASEAVGEVVVPDWIVQPRINNVWRARRHAAPDAAN